jgi:hypothetical protein
MTPEDDDERRQCVYLTLKKLVLLAIKFAKRAKKIRRVLINLGWSGIVSQCPHCSDQCGSASGNVNCGCY